jgi:hypothetical protein
MPDICKPEDENYENSRHASMLTGTRCFVWSISQEMKITVLHIEQAYTVS